MHVVIGSKNKAKVKAVETVFKNHQISSLSVSSNISVQPLTNKETRKGAINRAYECYKQIPEAICIGLEGGVMMIEDTLYLCSWGALVINGKLFTAGGANVPLPSKFIEPLHNGLELAELMESYTKIRDVRHHAGAVGVFTNDAISRSKLFAHTVTLLKGQAQYYKKIK